MLRCLLAAVVASFLVAACGEPGADIADAMPPDSRIIHVPDAPMPGVMVDESPIFLRADIGSVAMKRLIVINTGNVDLWPLATTTDAAAFTATSCGLLIPGDSCEVFVTYTPFAVTAREAQLMLTFRDTELTKTIPLRGEAFTYLRVEIVGHGQVVAQEAGLDCTPLMPCVGHFVQGATLTAIGMPGYRFVGWSEPSCGPTSACALSADAAGYFVWAFFSPEADSLLDVQIAASHATAVMVLDTTPGAYGILGGCTSSCQVPVPVGHSVTVTAVAPSGVTTIEGACSGNASCSFTNLGSTSITAATVANSHERWAQIFSGFGALRSVAFDSQNNIVATSNECHGDQGCVVKVSPDGDIIWFHPGLAGTVAVGPNDSIVVDNTNRIDFLDRDGYSRAIFNFDGIDQQYAGSTAHYIRQHLVLPDGHTVGVGHHGGFSIQAVADLGGTIWTRSSGLRSLQSVTVDATQTILAAVLTSDDTVRVLRYRLDGSSMAPLDLGIPASRVVMAPSTTGDLVIASSPPEIGAPVATLQRVGLDGTVRFRRAFELQSFVDPVAVGVVQLADDRTVWLRPVTRQDDGGNGFTLEAMTPTGTTTWQMTRPADVAARDLAVHGSSVVLAGSYWPLTQTRGWIEVIDP